MNKVNLALAAGLIACVVASHAPAAAQFQNAQEQRVELANFDFTPREMHLHAGQAYVLVLTNTASGGHNFAAREFFAAARVQPSDAAQVVNGKVEVPGKSTRTIHLVPAAGTYKLTCSHTFHTTFGMKGTIVVE